MPWKPNVILLLGNPLATQNIRRTGIGYKYKATLNEYIQYQLTAYKLTYIF